VSVTVLGVNLAILLDKRVRYVKMAKNHWHRINVSQVHTIWEALVYIIGKGSGYMSSYGYAR